MRASVPVSIVLACACFAADAASVQVNIAGTIVPSSCTPTLSGGGVIDFGAIDATTLSSTGTTALAGRAGDFSIACTGPTVMAFRITDNQLTTELGSETSYGFGLGLTVGGARIGRYNLRLTPLSVLADSAPASLIHSLTLQSWSDANPDNLLRHANPDLAYSFTDGPVAPMTLHTASFEFTVLPTINSRNALALTQAVALDGSASIEILYL